MSSLCSKEETKKMIEICKTKEVEVTERWLNAKKDLSLAKNDDSWMAEKWIHLDASDKITVKMEELETNVLHWKILLGKIKNKKHQLCAKCNVHDTIVNAEQTKQQIDSFYEEFEAAGMDLDK